jgi:hypothetical protein
MESNPLAGNILTEKLITKITASENETLNHLNDKTSRTSNQLLNKIMKSGP